MARSALCSAPVCRAHFLTTKTHGCGKKQHVEFAEKKYEYCFIDEAPSIHNIHFSSDYSSNFYRHIGRIMRLTGVLLDVVLKTGPRQFVDSLRLYVKGGKGGNGLEKYGGIGGKGGDVWIVPETTKDPQNSLKKLYRQNTSQRYEAGNGTDSVKMAIKGSPGEDMKVEVPLGIAIMTDEGEEIGEINNENDKFLAARGGIGGGVALQYRGQKGEARHIRLDLKILADVGLVGFPNAGKSTLLSVLSEATPRIASFPFTTIAPEVGILQYLDYRQIAMADLPGLIEGAHKNVGLGHRFLRHVERTRLLLFVIDINGFRLSPLHPFRTAFETLVLLNKELELYKESLTDKPALLAVNKLDVPGAEKKYKEFVELVQNYKEAVSKLDESVRPMHLVTFDDVIPMSCIKVLNTDLLKTRVREVIDRHCERDVEEARKNFIPSIRPRREVTNAYS